MFVFQEAYMPEKKKLKIEATQGVKFGEGAGAFSPAPFTVAAKARINDRVGVGAIASAVPQRREGKLGPTSQEAVVGATLNVKPFARANFDATIGLFHAGGAQMLNAAVVSGHIFNQNGMHLSGYYVVSKGEKKDEIPIGPYIGKLGIYGGVEGKIKNNQPSGFALGVVSLKNGGLAPAMKGFVGIDKLSLNAQVIVPTVPSEQLNVPAITVGFSVTW